MTTSCPRIRFIPVLAVLLASSALIPLSAAEPEWNGEVVSVTDGDTLQILREGSAVRVRLHGIDAPERRQPFGSAAKRYASELAYGKIVRVQPVDTDRYGRTVANITLPDGRSLNSELVRAGLAWWYRQYAPYDREFENLESAARQARRGIWADADPVSPWEWRRRPEKTAPSRGDRTRAQLRRSEVRSRR